MEKIVFIGRRQIEIRKRKKNNKSTSHRMAAKENKKRWTKFVEQNEAFKPTANISCSFFS